MILKIVLSWLDSKIFDYVAFFNVMEIFKTPKDIIMILGKLIGFKESDTIFL